jgi:chaperone required for assembly of F1-ATPase
VKRFWHTASLIERDGAYSVALDGKPMRLPGGPELRLPHGTLAGSIAAEWQQAGGAQGGTFALEDVPLTRLAGTAQHQIAPDPAPTAAALARYGESDLLCYRAAHPDALVIRQHHAWQPWLDWSAQKFGARLLTTNTINHITQPAPALGALRLAVDSLDAFQLAGLGILVPAYGSLILGLAVAEGELTATDAHTVSMLDELFQESLWGEDAEAVKRRAHVANDIAIAGRFLDLTKAR